MYLNVELMKYLTIQPSDVNVSSDIINQLIHVLQDVPKMNNIMVLNVYVNQDMDYGIKYVQNVHQIHLLILQEQAVNVLLVDIFSIQQHSNVKNVEIILQTMMMEQNVSVLTDMNKMENIVHLNVMLMKILIQKLTHVIVNMDS